MKTLLVIGGGEESIVSIKCAKAMGLRVVVSDGNLNAPGFQWADEYIVASTYDIEATCNAVIDGGYYGVINGVIALVADVPMTVSAVAKMLSLHGLPIDVAYLGANKIAMKQRLQALSVLTAQGQSITSIPEAADFRSACRVQGKVAIVKPLDSRGARGVVRLLPGVSTEWAFRQAHHNSPTGRVLIEEVLPGPQISTETIVLGPGIATTPGFLDRNYSRLDEFEPYVIEDGAEGPTRLSDWDKARIIAVANRVALALTGGVPCTVKGDMVLTLDGPAVIEMALRLSGGYMSSELIPIATGVDIVGIAIRLALGETVTLEECQPTRDRGVAIRYAIPPGATNHTDRRGHAIAYGPTRQEAVNIAEAAVREIL